MRNTQHSKPGSDFIAVGLIVVALYGPVCFLILMHVSLTGVMEESAGYRYFHSLRILYSGELPWSVQGQLIGIVHLGIQFALTILGFPPTQLFPRIDLFIYSAVVTAHSVAIATFVWAARSLETWKGRAFMAMAVAVVSFDPGSWGIYRLLQPDYHPWVLSISLFAAGWILRLCDKTVPTKPYLESWFTLGLFGGACLGVKPSYAVFPLAVGLVLLGHEKSSRRLWSSFGASVCSLVIWVVITYSYYLGSIRMTLYHFQALLGFTQHVAWSEAVSWLAIVFGSPPSMMWISAALPLVLVAGTGFLPERWLSLSLLPGSLLSLLFVRQRFASHTIFEANHYALMALVVWSTRTMAPWVRHALQPRFMRWAQVTTWSQRAAAVALGAVAVTFALQSVMVWLPLISDIDRAGRALRALLSSIPGKTVFLLPDNSWRPTTVDSAIHKGGIDTRLGVAPEWNSAFVRALFPEREYLLPDRISNGVSHYSGRPVDLASYDKVVFTRDTSAEGWSNATARLREVFGIQLDGLDCSREIGFRGYPPQIVVVCVAQRPTRRTRSP